ncbi:hypothetical protein [Streptomyces sioyaensis]|uniref:hypothetical protein n=1 Tax=Streptomyces sioyaensis TaxID=67364 RepID=UPI0037A28118
MPTSLHPAAATPQYRQRAFSYVPAPQRGARNAGFDLVFGEAGAGVPAAAAGAGHRLARHRPSDVPEASVGSLVL